MLVCSPADPFGHSPRFLEDVRLVAGAAAIGKALPSFVPLGMAPRTGERLLHCDPSGAPQSHALLPIGPMWRAIFEANPDELPLPPQPAKPTYKQLELPLWLEYTPGAIFAVSRDAVLRTRRALFNETAVAFYERVLKTSGMGGESATPIDPAARSHAFERLWRYVFVDASTSSSM